MSKGALLTCTLLSVAGCVTSDYERILRAIENDNVAELVRLDAEGALQAHIDSGFATLLYMEALRQPVPNSTLDYLTRESLLQRFGADTPIRFLVEECSPRSRNSISPASKEHCRSVLAKILTNPSLQLKTETRLAICLWGDARHLASGHAASPPDVPPFAIGARIGRLAPDSSVVQGGKVQRLCVADGAVHYGITDNVFDWFYVVTEDRVRDIAREEAEARVVTDAAEAAARKLRDEQSAKEVVIDARDTLLRSAGEDNLAGVAFGLSRGAALEDRNSDQETALFIAAKRGHASVVAYLLKAGAKPDVKARYGGSALAWASQNGHLEVVKLLIAAGADVNEVNTSGWSVLNLAKDNKRTEVVAVLLAAGAKETPAPERVEVGAARLARRDAVVTGPPAKAVAAPSQRQLEILEEIGKAERKIASISEELAQLPGAPTSGPTYDRKTITGQSCDRLGNNCTNTYQGGTESVSSYYARTDRGRRPALENELAQVNARRDFWIEELRKLDP